MALLCSALAYALWARGHTIQELVRNPPPQVDLPEFVTILSYLHHELIKHRLPLVRTISARPLEQISPEDVLLLQEGVTGGAGRPSLVGELDGYLQGLQRASGRIHLNLWRDPLVRRARRACVQIQKVADGLSGRQSLRPSEHRRLREAEEVLNGWFRPRLQALRSSVLSLQLDRDLFDEPVERVQRELGLPEVRVDMPALAGDGPQVRMLRADFNLVLRNLVRNALQHSAQATGSPRVAMELDRRVELTGEESVLLRIYDTDPTVLKRQQLYGGQIGRGLNLVTTTLRRYGGSLRSARSRREGFAKFMEVRLFQADFDEEAAELLRRPGLLNRFFPAALFSSLGLILALSVAGMLGYVPDPVEQLLRPSEEAFAQARGRAQALAPHLARGGRQVAAAVVEAQEVRRAQQPMYTVPGAEDFQVPNRRCDQPRRFVDERRVRVQCNLVENTSSKLGGRLEPPLLVLEVEPLEGKKPIPLSPLTLTAREQVTEDGQTRTLDPRDSCLDVLVVDPGRDVPQAQALLLTNSQPRRSAWSRVLVDYSRCLGVPRYPIQATVRLAEPEDPEAETPTLATTLELSVQLSRPEEAETAYLRISNDKRWLPERNQRVDLVQAIAQHIARQLDYARTAGNLPPELHGDLAKALYYGWVRPGIYRGIWERLDRQRSSKGPDDALCASYDELEEGAARLEDPELDIRQVHAERYRSQYYAMHGLLWIKGDVQGTMQALDDFQSENSKRTDFVQGARLYLAALLGLTEPPGNEGDPQAAERLERMTQHLLQLRRDARRPPRRGVEERYDKVRLMGIQALLEDEEEESFTVDAVVCGFAEAYPRWTSVIDERSREKLFKLCPGYQPPARELPPGEEPEVPAPPVPDPELSAQIARVKAYLEVFQEVIANPNWRCR